MAVATGVDLRVIAARRARDHIGDAVVIGIAGSFNAAAELIFLAVAVRRPQQLPTLGGIHVDAAGMLQARFRLRRRRRRDEIGYAVAVDVAEAPGDPTE